MISSTLYADTFTSAPAWITREPDFAPSVASRPTVTLGYLRRPLRTARFPLRILSASFGSARAEPLDARSTAHARPPISHPHAI